MTNQEEADKSSIQAENIGGFVFLSSGKTDELWPSEQMCKAMMRKLKDVDFKHPYEHVSFDGGHQPSKHWVAAFRFLDRMSIK